MADAKKDSAEEVQFPLNQQLLEEAAKIREERNVIKERLKKIETTKGEISESVYNRVKNDYLKQLSASTDKLLEKKQDIDRELATLGTAKKKVGENVVLHREKIEEMDFRYKLGEFKESEYHKLANEENDKLAKFEKILAAIETNISAYESLFEGEEDLLSEGGEEAPPPPPSAAPEPKKPKPETVTNVEEEYHVGGEGYFGPNTEEIKVGKTEFEEKTSKDLKKPQDAGAAKLSITEGEGAGKEYKLERAETIIGRASSNQIILKEAKVSRQHAVIKRQGREYLLTDLQSSNGVFVNDEKIKEHALSDGDVIKIGDFVMKFSQG